MTYELIEVRTEGGKVGIVTLNRPKQLNALNNQRRRTFGVHRHVAAIHDLCALGPAHLEPNGVSAVADLVGQSEVFEPA